MPRRCSLDPRFESLLEAQDFVVHRDQAVSAGMSRGALRHRLNTGWRPLLPSVYLTQHGEPSRRQRLIAAVLYGGDDAAIDGVDACHFYGVKVVRPDERFVHLVVPATSHVRSREWLVVRRSSSPYGMRSTSRVRYVEPADAVIAATRSMRSRRSIVAAMSDAIQRRVVDIDELVRAHNRGSRVNAKVAGEVLAELGAGPRSAPEVDFRRLAEAVPTLPPLLYNPLIQLPDGQCIRPDALAPDAALIHETNGAVAHRRHDLFEDMQRRHDAATASGFTVLHNSPRRIREQGHDVIREFEKCYHRLRKAGWPPGVVLLDDGR